MYGSRTVFWVTAVVFASLWAEPFAIAQRRRRQPQEEQAAPDDSTQRARVAYERGRTEFAAGNFQDALTAFQEAYDAKPHPTVLVSIAECQERLEQWTALAETLQRYLRDSPQARDRVQMEEKLAAIRARPALLNVSSEPPGGQIFLDGTDTGKVTPAELEVAPGDHTIKVTLEGHVDAEEQVTLSFAERRDMPMTLDTADTDGSTQPEPATTREPQGTPAAMYIGAGLAGVGLVAGSVFGFLALSEKSDFDDSPNVDSADRGERYALIADISFGVAVAAGIATAVLYFTRSGAGESPEAEEDVDDGTDDTQDEDYVRLRVLPLATRGGGGLAARLDF